MLDGAREARRGLVGQAVDEVDVDAAETECARLRDQIAGHFERLDAMDGFLHFGVEILNAEAQAIEAEAPQGFRDAARW